MRRWAAARPLAVREAPSRQTSVRREACQISVWREACPPARRPRRELRSARRLEARPGPAGLAPLSSRAAALRHRRYIPRRPRPPPIGQSHPMSGTKLPLLRTSNAHPGQNSPHTKPGGPNRYKTLPADGPNGPTRDKTLPTHHKTAIPSHFSLAGRTLYRSIHQQAEQGELCTAHRTTSGTKLSPLNSSAEATGQNSPRSS